MALQNIKENSFALLGSGIGYSVSPAVHSAVFACKNIENSYELADVPAEDLADAVDILRAKNVNFNVTIPFKEKIIPFLDYVDPMCKVMGSVNTVKNEKGRLYGYSTDGYGFQMSFAIRGVDFKDKKALILGSGGAARAICYNLLENGATVAILSRNQATASVLVKDLTDVFGENKIYVAQQGENCDILVNTTPLGTIPKCAFATREFYGAKYYFDAVYNPVKTKAVCLAQQLGITAFGGLDMLIWQAIRAEEIWNGITINPEEYKEIYRKCEEQLLKSSKRILLTGFMGVGKSTVGKILAEKTGLSFYDLDDYIITREGKSINEIFAEVGEKGFRDAECACLGELLEKQGGVIALGGGALLQEKNREIIEKYGCFTINMQCSLDTVKARLAGDDTRPLLKSGNIEDIFAQRRDNYVKYSDFTVSAEGSPQKTAQDIYDMLYKAEGNGNN